MKTGHKIVSLGCLAVGVASAVRWRWMIRMPLQEFTRYALYMAVMDDEICRNELEGNQIGDEIITFPPKVETLQERYHLFLQMKPGEKPPTDPSGNRGNGAATPGVQAVRWPAKRANGG